MGGDARAVREEGVVLSLSRTGLTATVGFILGGFDGAGGARRRPRRRPRGNVQLFALGHERETRERVGVLAAEQSADAAAGFGGDDAEAVPVAGAPDEFLVEGRHEFAVVREDASLVRDEDGGVPEAPQRRGAALGEADVCVDLGLGAGLLQLLDFWARDDEGLGAELGEEMVVVYWGGEGGLEEEESQHGVPDSEGSSRGFILLELDDVWSEGVVLNGQMGFSDPPTEDTQGSIDR